MIPMAETNRHTGSNWEYAALRVGAGDFYAHLLSAVELAQETIDFEYYIFQLDDLGWQFVDALGQAASRGVRVRVLVDGLGSSASSETLARELFQRGVSVQIYHPLPWLTGSYRWSRSRGGWVYKFMVFLLNINRRNHRKLCVVDGKQAWVGSFNISQQHLPLEAGGAGWRDYALELRGNEVRSLVDGFERLWEASDPRFHRGFFGRYLSNRSNRSRRMKNRFVARSVATASSRVWLVSAYFAPTASLRRALLHACKAGRGVILLLPEQSDVPMFPSLSSHYYRELLRAGARIFLYQEGILHAKALLIDEFSIIGSSNWNYRSSLHDLELDVVVKGGSLAAELEQIIRDDCDLARELKLADAHRPGLVSWLWYLLRYWM